MCGILLLEIVGNPWEIVNAPWKIREKIFSHKVFINGIIPWKSVEKSPYPRDFPPILLWENPVCVVVVQVLLKPLVLKECKEDANATTGTSMDKSGKETGTSEVDAVNVEKDGTGTTYVRKNVDSDEEGEVEHVYDETTTFMASTSSKNEGSKSGSRVGNTSLYKNLDVNIKKEKVHTKINIYGSLHL
ncbi:hypothetical protein Tco_0541445 [Tanacetum coccineum]